MQRGAETKIPLASSQHVQEPTTKWQERKIGVLDCQIMPNVGVWMSCYEWQKYTNEDENTLYSLSKLIMLTCFLGTFLYINDWNSLIDNPLLFKGTWLPLGAYPFAVGCWCVRGSCCWGTIWWFTWCNGWEWGIGLLVWLVIFLRSFVLGTAPPTAERCSDPEEFLLEVELDPFCPGVEFTAVTEKWHNL